MSEATHSATPWGHRQGGGRFGGLTMRKAAPPVSSAAWMAVSTSRLDFSSCSLYWQMRLWMKAVLSACSWEMRCSSSAFFSSSSAARASKRAQSSRLAASLFSCGDKEQGMSPLCPSGTCNIPRASHLHGLYPTPGCPRLRFHPRLFGGLLFPLSSPRCSGRSPPAGR